MYLIYIHGWNVCMIYLPRAGCLIYEKIKQYVILTGLSQLIKKYNKIDYLPTCIIYRFLKTNFNLEEVIVDFTYRCTDHVYKIMNMYSSIPHRNS